MNKGYVFLSRKILEWEWADDNVMFAVFIKMIIKANHSKALWHGIDIDRGEMLVSVRRLAQEFNVSYQTLRTILKKLEESGTITVKPTQKLTQINIINYKQYQGLGCNNQRDDNATLTQEQRNANATLTQIEQIRIINNNNNLQNACACTHEEFKIISLGDQIWCEAVARLMYREGGSAKDIKQHASDFNDFLTSQGKIHNTLNEWKSHFTYWLRQVLQDEHKTNYNEKNTTDSKSKRRGYDAEDLPPEAYEVDF